MYWNKQIETMPREGLRALQSERLKDAVQRVYDNVPYYSEKMKQMGVAPGDIRSIDDLYKLPFTLKTDLRANYPFNTFAVPMDQIVRIHASSGTTGKQTVVGYTKNDIEMWTDCVARCLTNAGVTNKDLIHVAYGYGLFTGGLGLHYGAERVGASTIPVSGGNSKRQIELLVDFQSTVLACTPSYALHLADEMMQMGITKEMLNLRVGIFGAEPWTEEMRKQIEEKLGLKAYDIYGLSETMGPGVSMNCEYNCGLHVQEDHFFPEIIDPDTGAVLPDGSVGELVFTCITKEALPLIRYRTRDLTRLFYETCGCGRTLVRMDKIKGRSDDMLIIRGVNVFPSQIESVLLSFGEVEPHYLIYIDRVDNLDCMEIQIEMTNSIFSDSIKDIERIENKLKREIESAIGIGAKIKLVEPRSIPRSEGKAKRVFDRREIYAK
jgi:phenylacetate-CoA ligase